METENFYETELQRRNRERREAIVAEFCEIMERQPAASRTAVYEALGRKYAVSYVTVMRYVLAAERSGENQPESDE